MVSRRLSSPTTALVSLPLNLRTSPENTTPAMWPAAPVIRRATGKLKELCGRWDLSWVRERIHTRHSWLRGLARCHMDHPQHSYWGGRHIRTPLPVSQDKLQPKWPELQDSKERMKIWGRNKLPGSISSNTKILQRWPALGSLRRDRLHIRVIPETPTVTRSGRLLRNPARMDL